VSGAVLLRVAYDGSGFHGFAAQRGQRTVAGDLLAAIAPLDPAVVKLRVASRTDAGVHAREQYVAFDTVRVMPMRAWVLDLAHRLPEAIAVRGAWPAPAGFHPRFETVQKRYRYLLHCEPVPDPLLARRAWHLYGLTNASDEVVARMDAELAACRGTHDFAAFASSADKRAHTERTMSHTAVTRDGPVIALDIAGDGFLHNMVRILVGTVVDVALARTEPGAIARALEAKDRRHAGQTAPPDGLYLEQVQLRAPPAERGWP
jgi:tRNA pseudouridine38-40 synthase